MDYINRLLDENYDWGDERIDEDTYDELSADLIIDYLKKHDPETRQMLVLSWNFDNPKKVIQWIVDQPDTDKGTILLLYWLRAPDFSKQYATREDCESAASWYLEDYDIIHDDSACEDVYDKDSALALFTEIIREKHNL